MSELEQGGGEAAETSALPGLRESLVSAFDAAETSAPERDTTEGAAPAKPASDTQSESVKAPQHWSKADHDVFATLPLAAQKRWVEREQEIDRGFQPKLQEAAQLRKEREEMDALFKPLSREMELKGITRGAAIKQLLAVEAYLREQPGEAFKWLAQNYGVDLAKLMQERSQNPADPQVLSLNQKVQQLEGQLTGFTKAQEKAQFDQQLAHVAKIAEEKGTDGKPLRPYFDEVVNEINAVIQSGERDVAAAYSKAIRMNDKVWTQIQADEALKTKQASDSANKEKVNRAKLASVGTQGVANGSARPKLSLREDLEQRFANY